MSTLFFVRPAVGIAVLLLLLTAPACDGNSEGFDTLIEGRTETTGTWLLSVVEQYDSCDDDALPEIHPRMIVEEHKEEYLVRFDEYDDSGWCWVTPFTAVADFDLRWEFVGAILQDPCNPGCRIRVDGSVDLSFGPFGALTGTEVTTYTPETPECDVPQCQFPCDPGTNHLVFRVPPMRRCGFACETRFAWTGALVPEGTGGGGCADRIGGPES